MKDLLSSHSTWKTKAKNVEGLVMPAVASIWSGHTWTVDTKCHNLFGDRVRVRVKIRVRDRVRDRVRGPNNNPNLNLNRIPNPTPNHKPNSNPNLNPNPDPITK